MLELFQLLTKKTFENTTIPDFYIENAKKIIINYTGLKYLDDDFNTPVVMLAVHLYSNAGSLNSITEGNKKIINFSAIIPPVIRAMLPYPKVKVM